MSVAREGNRIRRAATASHQSVHPVTVRHVAARSVAEQPVVQSEPAAVGVVVKKAVFSDLEIGKSTAAKQARHVELL